MATKLFVFLTVLVFQQNSFADDFKLVKRGHSISLYERWIRHNGNEVRELKAEFMIKTANTENLVQLIRNESKGLEWNNKAIAYKVRPGKQQNSWLTYIRYDVPWPFNDYDCLLAYQYEENPGNGRIAEISFKSTVSGQFPVPGDVTRITGTQGKWMLEDQGGSLKVTYLVATDRSKKMPRYISDPVVHDNLFKTMTRFKQLLEHNT